MAGVGAGCMACCGVTMTDPVNYTQNIQNVNKNNTNADSEKQILSARINQNMINMLAEAGIISTSATGIHALTGDSKKKKHKK